MAAPPTTLRRRVAGAPGVCHSAAAGPNNLTLTTVVVKGNYELCCLTRVGLLRNSRA